MALPLPVPSRSGSSLRFRVLGFPVDVHISFWLVSALIAFGGGLTVTELIAWILIVGVSVLAHELGHAVLARRAGAHPAITLYAMGGVTYWRPPQQPRRSTLIGVSVAGPLTGVAIGLAALAVEAATTPDGLLKYVIEAAIWVNLGWGLLNLLPLLPLDGGHVLASLLPGNDVARMRRASAVSAVVGVGAAIAGVSFGYVFAGALGAYFAYTNFATWQQMRRPVSARARPLDIAQRALLEGDAAALRTAGVDASHAPDESARHFARQLAASAHVLAGHPQHAVRELLDAGSEAPVDPLLEATVLIATGQEQLGRERLVAAHAAGESPFFALLAWGCARFRPPLLPALDALLPQGMRASEAAVAMAVGYHARDLPAAVELGRRALAGGFDPGGLVSYDLACVLALQGDRTGAVAALRDAARHGFRDVNQADSDPDLELVRQIAEWPSIRDELGGRLGSPPEPG